MNILRVLTAIWVHQKREKKTRWEGAKQKQGDKVEDFSKDGHLAP